MQKNIPYGLHWIDADDIDAVTDVLRGEWLTQGPLVARFEEEIAAYAETRYAVAFNSGTSALHGAMFAAGVAPGDEIVTSPITFVATANAAVYLGARPVFADIDMDTYCIDTDRIKNALTERTKVIAPVDMAGYPVDIAAVNEIAAERDLVVIEDAAHALGAKRNGVKVGSQADMTMFSFHPVKHITTGEGGIITTDSDEYAEKLRQFRSHGITKDASRLAKNDGPWYYEMQYPGYNYRITDIQCALGISQLKKLERFVTRRNEIAGVYDEAFLDIPQIITPPQVHDPRSRHAYHLYPVRVQGTIRKELFLKLRERGIFCQVHYIPVHLQPFYRTSYGYGEGDYPVSEEYYRTEISLPMFPRMANEDISRVIESVRTTIAEMS